MARLGFVLANWSERWFPDPLVFALLAVVVVFVGGVLAVRDANRHGAWSPLGWVVQIYNASEALPNLVNPFWMLPLSGVLKIRARDLVGYGILQLMVPGAVGVFLMLDIGPDRPFCWSCKVVFGFRLSQLVSGLD